MKHTPGPWYVSSGDQPQIVSESTNDGRTLCLVYEVRDETQANAKLIAASPELLEALQFALEWINEIKAKHPEVVPAKGWGTIGIESAITKALGTGPA